MATIYDVAVIGGGPAGYVAAIKAAQLGGKVILFEKDTVGGTCLNRGCIPTKTYLKTAEYIHSIKHAEKRGIVVDASTLKVEMPRVLANKNQVVKTLTGGVAGLLSANGVEVVASVAKCSGGTRVEAGGKTYEAKNILLCGGSKAGSIPVPGIDLPCVMNSDGILEIDHIPARLAVIGGGVIGCEIATAFSAFGSEVTVIEAMPSLVSTMEEDIGKTIAKCLKRDRVKVLTGAKLLKIEQSGGEAVLTIEGKEPLRADLVLLSVGRVADLECLGALAAQIKTERGKIVVDEGMRTSLPNVYAAGDLVAGAPMLAHAAFKMGEVAAANAMGRHEKADLSLVPGCLYTLPEASGVGMTEAQAKEKGLDVSIGMFRMAANGRSVASGETDGFIKVIVGKRYGEILGVHMVCAAAAELIGEAKLAMDMQITVHEIAETIHAHPTFHEALMEACADALGSCIHLSPKKKNLS